MSGLTGAGHRRRGRLRRLLLGAAGGARHPPSDLPVTAWAAACRWWRRAAWGQDRRGRVVPRGAGRRPDDPNSPAPPGGRRQHPRRLLVAGSIEDQVRAKHAELLDGTLSQHARTPSVCSTPGTTVRPDAGQRALRPLRWPSGTGRRCAASLYPLDTQLQRRELSAPAAIAAAEPPRRAGLGKRVMARMRSRLRYRTLRPIPYLVLCRQRSAGLARNAT